MRKAWTLAAVLAMGALTAQAVEARTATARPFPLRLTGVGTEPFWNIALDGARLRYASPERNRPLVARVTRRETNGVLRLAGTLGGWRLRAVVRRGRCSDGMSDRVYPYKLALTLNRRTLSGCAYPGSPPRE